MSAPFTPEQEARIADIVGETLLAIERCRIAGQTSCALDELHTAIAWAISEQRDASDA